MILILKLICVDLQIPCMKCADTSNRTWQSISLIYSYNSHAKHLYYFCPSLGYLVYTFKSSGLLIISILIHENHSSQDTSALMWWARFITGIQSVFTVEVVPLVLKLQPLILQQVMPLRFIALAMSQFLAQYHIPQRILPRPIPFLTSYAPPHLWPCQGYSLPSLWKQWIWLLRSPSLYLHFLTKPCLSPPQANTS